MAAILFSQMEPPAELEQEFNAWYTDEHVPVRMELEGFLAATRYRAVSGSPAYLAVYEIADLEVLESAEYRDVKERPSERTRNMLESIQGFTRYICEQTDNDGEESAGQDAGWLSVVAHSVPADELDQYDAWYRDEHTGKLLLGADWLRVRRYRVLSGDGPDWTNLSLHDLRNAAAMDSPERAEARTGPLRDALAEREWFGRSGRWLYELIDRVR
jgi:hypothetical protein